MRNGDYILVTAPKDYPGVKYRGRYVYEHQLVWFQSRGRLVPYGCMVHHVNGDKHDNRPENLEVVDNVLHGIRHRKNKRIPHKTLTGYKYYRCRCEKCKEANTLYTRIYRLRKFRSSLKEKRQTVNLDYVGSIPTS